MNISQVKEWDLVKCKVSNTDLRLVKDKLYLIDWVSKSDVVLKGGLEISAGPCDVHPIEMFEYISSTTKVKVVECEKFPLVVCIVTGLPQINIGDILQINSYCPKSNSFTFLGKYLGYNHFDEYSAAFFRVVDDTTKLPNSRITIKPVYDCNGEVLNINDLVEFKDKRYNSLSELDRDAVYQISNFDYDRLMFLNVNGYHRSLMFKKVKREAVEVKPQFKLKRDTEVTVSTLQMYQSLLDAVTKAGGSPECFEVDKLKNMSVITLIQSLSNNHVRFVCSKD